MMVRSWWRDGGKIIEKWSSEEDEDRVWMCSQSSLKLKNRLSGVGFSMFLVSLEHTSAAQWFLCGGQWMEWISSSQFFILMNLKVMEI